MPAARELEHADRYPHDLVARMRELGLFAALVPEAYGGLGLDCTTYAQVIEEICRGFMSLAGVLNSHTMAALILLAHGTEAQRGRFLPRLAHGEARGGLALTEPHAGTDVQAIRTVAKKRGDAYVLNGTKMFVTNGRESISPRAPYGVPLSIRWIAATEKVPVLAVIGSRYVPHTRIR